MGAGGGDVVHRAGLHGETHSGNPSGARTVGCAAVGVRLAGVPQVDDRPLTLMAGSAPVGGDDLPSKITWAGPRPGPPSAWCRSGAARRDRDHFVHIPVGVAGRCRGRGPCLGTARSRNHPGPAPPPRSRSAPAPGVPRRRRRTAARERTSGDVKRARRRHVERRRSGEGEEGGGGGKGGSVATARRWTSSRASGSAMASSSQVRSRADRKTHMFSVPSSSRLEAGPWQPGADVRDFLLHRAVHQWRCRQPGWRTAGYVLLSSRRYPQRGALITTPERLVLARRRA